MKQIDIDQPGAWSLYCAAKQEAEQCGNCYMYRLQDKTDKYDRDILMHGARALERGLKAVIKASGENLPLTENLEELFNLCQDAGMLVRRPVTPLATMNSAFLSRENTMNAADSLEEKEVARIYTDTREFMEWLHDIFSPEDAD